MFYNLFTISFAKQIAFHIMQTSNQIRLKADIIEKIRNQDNLAIGVANKLNIELFSLPSYLQRNSRRLTEIAVLNYLSRQLNIDMLDLVSETNLELIA